MKVLIANENLYEDFHVGEKKKKIFIRAFIYIFKTQYYIRKQYIVYDILFFKAGMPQNWIFLKLLGHNNYLRKGLITSCYNFLFAPTSNFNFGYIKRGISQVSRHLLCMEYFPFFNQKIVHNLTSYILSP